MMTLSKEAFMNKVVRQVAALLPVLPAFEQRVDALPSSFTLRWSQ
jgi:hypothetical protein